MRVRVSHTAQILWDSVKVTFKAHNLKTAVRLCLPPLGNKQKKMEESNIKDATLDIVKTINKDFVQESILPRWPNYSAVSKFKSDIYLQNS